MCFSAEVDLVAGVVIGSIGIDAVRHVTAPAQQWLASIPIVLGAHQLIESVVWWGLEGHFSEGVWRFATWWYLAIAFGLLPVLVPVAVTMLEPVASRRRASIFVTLGVAVAAVLMYAVVRGPVEARIEGRHIAYTVDLWHGSLIVLLYVVATCGSLLASQRRHVRWFGFANLIAVAALAWIDQNAVISVWCAWAAVTSVAIALHLRAVGSDPQGAVGRPISSASSAS
jgi:cytochrome b561